MSDPIKMLSGPFARALKKAFGDDVAITDPQLRPAQHPRFGDYQANLAMSLAKRMGRNPRAIAETIVDALQVDDLCSRVDIAGPGFINLTLSPAALGNLAAAMAADPRLGVSLSPAPQTVVIDYSSPNVAKEMHVGHLRSTIIGDALARTLAFMGHAVVRQNHMGDWGTQFGMLIEHLGDQLNEHPRRENPASTTIGDLNVFYQQAKQRFDDDADFATRARARVVTLQTGDRETLSLWETLVETSKAHFFAIYARLGVTLSDSDVRPESFYNPMLPQVVRLLTPLTTLDDGAVCIFVPGFAGPDDSPTPLIVQKSDGGFGYAATDLAAIRYRVEQLRATRIIYVVDSRQADHFAMVFWAATQMGWLGERATAQHVRFGTILGADNKPFKTRSGETIKLTDLLDEAQTRALAIVAAKNPELAADAQKTVATAVALGAVKYADLSCDRVKDYVFNWDRMLAMDGNTAPYLQYAVARIVSIFRKADRDMAATILDPQAIIDHPDERMLVRTLVQFEAVLESVVATLEPHRLCAFLFEVAAAFSTFYNRCPVLKAEDAATTTRRLGLTALTCRVLTTGLTLLGIDTVERM